MACFVVTKHIGAGCGPGPEPIQCPLVNANGRPAGRTFFWRTGGPPLVDMNQKAVRIGWERDLDAEAKALAATP